MLKHMRSFPAEFIKGTSLFQTVPLTPVRDHSTLRRLRIGEKKTGYMQSICSVVKGCLKIALNYWLLWRIYDVRSLDPSTENAIWYEGMGAVGMTTTPGHVTGSVPTMMSS